MPTELNLQYSPFKLYGSSADLYWQSGINWNGRDDVDSEKRK